ncbi:MAG: SDR family oxidoreductase [Puniceicoccaceae bacterium]|nr:MAG: SDR family oxidoreductase [Puniceicoccaceae bacterium]
MPVPPRLILITGASRGLGRALVDRFVEAGHTVLGCSRRAAAVETLGRRHGSPHRFAVVDVADAGSVRDWARALEADGLVPDLLINNAGLINPPGPLWEMSPEAFATVINVNLIGAGYVLQAFLPAIAARGSGVVVNLSSGWGRSVSPEVAPYCASKWGMEGLSKAVAAEVPPGVAVVPLNPGIIDTEMLATAFGPESARYPGPEEWSRRAAPFLLKLKPSDNGKSLTVS